LGEILPGYADGALASLRAQSGDHLKNDGGFPET
jgi:hypothetical protein